MTNNGGLSLAEMLNLAVIIFGVIFILITIAFFYSLNYFIKNFLKKKNTQDQNLETGTVVKKPQFWPSLFCVIFFGLITFFILKGIVEGFLS